MKKEMKQEINCKRKQCVPRSTRTNMKNGGRCQVTMIL
uniref:Uncharacterized protein n=1 Tax=Cucumis melo TaxID=3656 RepID=A0A9I9DS90_CUCME